ncbi:MAG: endonuclease [Candidatus Diapherotrites archaeon]|uniref:Endonuclease n=1 Tax=Candidatus Iainarchaeum sp. TaxID=3101447 RepID=A0A8T3YQR3_9ARCH|nr:endonuclease [Candidatus Diapherotrites archaeon]
MADFLFLAVVIATLALFAVVLYLLARLSSLESALSILQFSKASQSVKYGKMTEHFMPFTKDFPFSPENFRFIGNPVDGIVFEDDRIVFAEFKAASSQLSQKQRRIRELVEKGKVEWFEQRLK